MFYFISIFRESRLLFYFFSETTVSPEKILSILSKFSTSILCASLTNGTNTLSTDKPLLVMLNALLSSSNVCSSTRPRSTRKCKYSNRKDISSWTRRLICLNLKLPLTAKTQRTSTHHCNLDLSNLKSPITQSNSLFLFNPIL